MIDTLLANPFLEPPRDALTPHSDTPLLVALAIATVASLAFGVVYTKRTRSPLYWWGAVSGWLLYPFLVEPFGDWFVAVWYPSNLHIAATVFGRDIPWLVVAGYGSVLPVAFVIAYEITRRGLPAKRLLQLVIAMTLFEVPLEILGGMTGWMIYYGNHATVFGVPIYCYIQNGGLFAVIAAVLAWQIPRTHGWRWVLVPITLAATLPVFAIVATFPAYIAIALKAGPVVGWSAGVLAAIMNAAVVVACIYSPAMKRFREQAHQPTQNSSRFFQ